MSAGEAVFFAKESCAFVQNYSVLSVLLLYCGGRGAHGRTNNANLVVCSGSETSGGYPSTRGRMCRPSGLCATFFYKKPSWRLRLILVFQD